MSPPGLNIAPSEDPSITSCLTQEAAEDDYMSLLGGASLSIDPSRYNIFLLGGDTYLTGGNVCQPEDESLRASTTTGYTNVSEVKRTTPLFTQ